MERLAHDTRMLVVMVGWEPDQSPLGLDVPHPMSLGGQERGLRHLGISTG